MPEAVTIDPRFIVNLKGHDYPTYAGVLDAATKAGLKSLKVNTVQIPTEANGWMAVVEAIAEFEDGRIFCDVGDASPKNCSAQIATAALRMASTRGKGRVLRDSINCGMTLLEEIPDDDQTSQGNGAAAGARSHQRSQPAARRPASGRSQVDAPASPVRPAAGVVDDDPAGEDAEVIACEECGVVLSAKAIQQCRDHADLFDGRTLCGEHRKSHAEQREVNARARVPSGFLA